MTTELTEYARKLQQAALMMSAGSSVSHIEFYMSQNSDGNRLACRCPTFQNVITPDDMEMMATHLNCAIRDVLINISNVFRERSEAILKELPLLEKSSD